MSLEKALEEIYSNTEGVELIALLGFDGVPVVSRGNEDKKTILEGEELNNVVGMIKNMLEHSQKVNFGVFERCLIEAKKYDFFFQVVNYEYFLLLVLEKAHNIGKARYLLKKWTP
ncbi:MAG TPA: hypothetical protein PKB05_10795, partial [Oligoflexia bacterium]|nr:hypothetical protein [Oligoflexia bacterium]